jgi:predicted nucleic acid-binding protein
MPWRIVGVPSNLEEIVLDANVLVGLADDNDSRAADARDIVRRLRARGAEPVLVDFLIGEALSALCRRFAERATLGLEPDLVFARYLHVEQAGQIRRLAAEGYARFDRVLAVVRETAGRLNVHDAMIVVLQREGRIGAVATFDEALATIPGFIRATI